MSGTEAIVISLIVSTGATIYSQQQQAEATERANDAAKLAGNLDANSREIQRKKRLMAAMASQANKAGAGGVRQNEGGFANINAQTLADHELNLSTDRAQKAAYNKSLDMNTETAKQTARISMVSTVADAGYTGATIGYTKPDKPTVTDTPAGGPGYR